MRTNHLFDTSNELLALRYSNGIKLLRPDQVDASQTTVCQVSDLLALPFNVYFKNSESTNINLNEITAVNNGTTGINDSLGKNPYDFSKKEYAELVVLHDKEVLKKRQMIMKNETFHRLKDDIILQKLAIKYPWYSADNEMIGIFGCSIVIDGERNFPVGQAISMLSNFGLLNPNILI